MALGLSHAIAQDPLLEYRRFKLYDETTEWWAPVADSVHLFDIVHGYSMEYGGDAHYAISMLGFNRHGLEYDEVGYRVGHLEVDYATARLMSQLGIERSVLYGVGAHLTPSAVEATKYDMLTPQRYSGHYVRGAFSGRNYLFNVSHRAVYKPNSGDVRLDNGLTIAHFVGVRTGRDLYVDGVYTEAVDAGVDVTYVDRRNSLRLVVLLPWSNRGLRRSSTEEAYSLLGNTMYNPLWGMYRGKPRNSGVRSLFRPEVVAYWHHTITLNTSLYLSLNVGYERSGRTSLMWYDAPTPIPDNYRYMPTFATNATDQSAATEVWTNNDLRFTQIDWDGLRHTNQIQPDGHARYAVDDNRTNRPYMRIAMGADSRIGSVDVECGLELGIDSHRAFKQMDDLLGGDHVLNVDYYIRDDATFSTMLDNDLRNPGRRVYQGDRYGYDYRLTRSCAAIYATAQWRYESMTFGLGARVAAELSWRRGYYEKESFEGAASYGRSAVVTSSPAYIAAVWHYDLGQHDLSCSLLLRGRSPEVGDMFLRPEYNNRIVGNARLESLYAAELSYSFASQRFNLRASLYAHWSRGERQVERYYDDIMELYTDVVVEGIDRLGLGLEVVAHVDWMRYLSSDFCLSLSRYRYTSNPDVTLYSDIDQTFVASSRSLMRGCRVGTPQVALYGDLCFRPEGGWMARLSLNYLGARYVDPSIVRRAERVVQRASSVEEREALLNQQRLGDVFTMDVAVGKSFRLGANRHYLSVQLHLTNLLSTQIVVDGYEQNRVRRTTHNERSSLHAMDNIVRYGYPRTVYLSVGFGF